MSLKSNFLWGKFLIRTSIIFIMLVISSTITYNITMNKVEKKIQNSNQQKLDYIYNNVINDSVKFDLMCLIANCDTYYFKHLEDSSYNLRKGRKAFSRASEKYNKEKINHSFTNQISLTEENLLSPNIVRSFEEIKKEINLDYATWYNIGNDALILKSPEYSLGQDILKNILMMLIIFLVFSILISYATIYADAKYFNYKRKHNLNNMNNNLRAELTESLHHELASPISIIESNMKYLMRYKLKCKYTENKLCTYYLHNSPIAQCSQCEYYKSECGERFKSSLLSIESIKDVLFTISQLKKMKYKKEHNSLSSILDCVVELNRINTYNSVNIAVIEKEKISDCYVAGTLGGGLLFNSIMTLVVNSSEADATQIIITTSLEDEFLDIMISDNGKGIKNITDKDKIFSYGYSTKEKNNNDNVKSLWSNILKAIFPVSNDHMTSRGAGLAIARKLLRDNGSDIELISTSPEGTVFKIRIPVINKSI